MWKWKALTLRGMPTQRTCGGCVHSYVHARQSSYWRQLKIFESGGPSVLPSPNITESANTYYIHPCASNLESRTEKRGAELEGAQQGRTAHSAAAVPLTEQKSQQFMMVHRCVETSGTHRPENKKKRKARARRNTHKGLANAGGPVLSHARAWACEERAQTVFDPVTSAARNLPSIYK